jgi:hypothetical protein
MPFVPPRTPISPRPSRSTGPVLSVGRRVFVNCPGGSSRRVTLTDDIGQAAVGTLTDGIEVEVIAWKPRGGGTRYRVRHQKDGLEGWLGVDELRVTPRPASAAAPAAATPPASAPIPPKPAPAAARATPAAARVNPAAARTKPRPAPAPAPAVSGRAKAGAKVAAKAVGGGRKFGARAR